MTRPVLINLTAVLLFGLLFVGLLALLGPVAFGGYPMLLPTDYRME